MTSSTEISKAVQLLNDGQLVAFPTETVYGLGADATNDIAVARVYQAKGRPSFNPLIVHVTEPAAAFELGAFDDVSKHLATTFWPGALTLVVSRPKRTPVSLLASAGMDTLAIRVPAHPVAQALLQGFGKPLVAPSANLSGMISPTTAEHVRDGLGLGVALILDGGASRVGVESTVVRVVDDVPYLLRAGGITRYEVEKVLGRRLMAHAANGTVLHSPGQLASHYAPRAALRLDAVAPELGETYLGFGAHSHGPYSLSRSGDLTEAAANLFHLLHEIDALSPGVIAVAPIPAWGLGEAINDRLTRAAAPRP